MTYARPLRVQLCLWPQGVILNSRKALRDVFGGVGRLGEVPGWIPGGSRACGLIYNVDLISRREEPGCPAPTTIRLVQEVLKVLGLDLRFRGVKRHGDRKSGKIEAWTG